MRIGERLTAIARQRCPQCLQGPVFEGILSMRDACPRCGHRFLRQQGYFQGAMYVSYVLAVLVFALLTGIGTVFAPIELVFLVVIPVYVLLVPVLYRYSRIIWMHVNMPTF
jgi:uncharacterized protein (DUF983 family)